MTQMAYDDGFERNRNESRSILEMRFIESGVVMLIGNKREKDEKKITKSPAGTRGYMVVTFATVEHWKGISIGSKDCKVCVSHTECVLPLRFTNEEVKQEVKCRDTQMRE